MVSRFFHVFCIAGLSLVWLHCSSGQEPADPCQGVTCSDHGTCEVVGEAASCNCESGWHADGLACLPDEGDLTPPSVPQDLSGTALSPHQVQLGWSASSDDTGVTGYRIFRNNQSIGTTSQTSYLDGGLAADTSYDYSVSAYDAAGNESDPCGSITVTTLTQTADTALANLAASMQPGEWAEFETIGFDDGAILVTDDDGSILEYNNEANWDPVGRRVFVVGTARGASAGYGMINQKWVQYSEESNTWTALPQLPFYLGFHSYDHAALNTTTGDYYLRIVGSAEVQKFGAESGNWAPIPDIPMSYESCCNSLEYFPEMGAIVFVRGNSDGDTEIFRYTEAGNEWVRLAAETDMPMGNFHDVAEYSPVHSILIFGGGTVYEVGDRAEMYALDANGDVTRLADSPFPFNLSGSLVVAEPGSGNLLLFSMSDMTIMHEYVVNDDTWITRPVDPIFQHTGAYGPRGIVATALPEYGVVMFIRHAVEETMSGVFLYKHAPR